MEVEKMTRPHKAATIWTTLLSGTFVVLLFPVLLSDRGFLPALLFTALGVGVIWTIYFAVGGYLSWVAGEAAKEREKKHKIS
jgi:hypothetical protein